MMSRVGLVCIVLAFVACGDDVVESATEVSDGPAVPVAQAPPPPANVNVELPTLPVGDRTIKVSTSLSKIAFTGAKITGSHDGLFKSFDGTVVMTEDQVVATSFTIDMDSVDADHPKLTKHLLGKDFFYAENYPTAIFRSVDVVPAENPGAVTHIVSGVLQLHGKRRPVNFPATIEMGAAAVTVSASFDINRQNWGVSYPGKKDDLIKDDVKIDLDLNFPVADASGQPE
jgi:polyisoprenoid-binding protein YceI